VPTPQKVLGYDFGDRISSHANIVRCLNADQRRDILISESHRSDGNMRIRSCFDGYLIVQLQSGDCSRLPAGTDAAALQRRKRRLVARLRIPAGALPGSLVLFHRPCGKPGCHCASGDSHPFYTLTFIDGNKHVRRLSLPEAGHHRYGPG